MEGELFSCGRNEKQLGLDTTEAAVLNFTKVSILEGIRISKISCGRVHTACIDEEGHLLVWGPGKDGRLGNGSTENHSDPQWVQDFCDEEGNQLDPEKLKVEMVACGVDHTLAYVSSPNINRNDDIERKNITNSKSILHNE